MKSLYQMVGYVAPAYAKKLVEEQKNRTLGVYTTAVEDLQSHYTQLNTLASRRKQKFDALQPYNRVFTTLTKNTQQKFNETFKKAYSLQQKAGDFKNLEKKLEVRAAAYDAVKVSLQNKAQELWRETKAMYQDPLVRKVAAYATMPVAAVGAVIVGATSPLLALIGIGAGAVYLSHGKDTRDTKRKLIEEYTALSNTPFASKESDPGLENFNVNQNRIIKRREQLLQELKLMCA